MADSKKAPNVSEVDLEEFLSEMVSIVKKRLDQQQGIMDDLKKRVAFLENRKNPESVIEEKLSEVAKSIGNLGGRLTFLEKKVNAPMTVTTELLETLGDKISMGETKDVEEKKMD